MASSFRTDLFAGKRVLVTGGGSGIGLGISKAFAAHGAHVVLASRSADRLKTAAAEVGALGPGGASWHSVDVRDADAVAGLAEDVGAVDVVVNNAAGNFPTPFLAMSQNAWDSVLGIVLGGTVNVCRAFGSTLMQRQGSMVNIVAGYAWTGAPGVSHSGAAKAGVLNLTRSLAVEWAPKVRVNAVSPGPIEGTEGMKRLGEDLGLDDVVRKSIPLRRMGRADDIAQACLYLASPAAAFVTGACLVVDGGQDAVGPFGALFQALQ